MLEVVVIAWIVTNLSISTSVWKFDVDICKSYYTKVFSRYPLLQSSSSEMFISFLGRLVCAYRGLTSPHRYRITSFSKLKRISQSDHDKFFILFFLAFKAFVMLVTFLLFQSNLYVVLVCGKGSKNSLPRALFKKKTKKTSRPSAVFYASYGGWIYLQLNWFSQIPQKRHLSKISS